MIIGSENWFDAIVRRLSGPVAAYLAQKRIVTADRISLLGLFLGGLAAPALVLGDQWLLATISFLLGDFADYVDGDVARAQGTASNRGDILDGIIDRYVDASILMAMTLNASGLVGGSASSPVFGAGSWLTVAVGLIAIFGAIMPSYVRAVASANGITTPESIGGRGTRNAIIVIGLALGLPAQGLLLVAFAGNGAALHRLYVALWSSEGQDSEVAP